MLVPLLAVLLVFLLLRGRGGRPIPRTLADLGALSLAGHQRLLVLAPHCDDETLSSAGLITHALGQGMEVRVVIATNGDGFLFATMEEFRRAFPQHDDFICMGIRRQAESLDALRLLGVSEDQVAFLSYPDRGLPALWADHWSHLNPYRSPYSGASHSPYPRTYNPQAAYAGEDLLADLRSILASFRPDLVVFPHPSDIHPDHWGLGVFARLAVTLAERDDPGFRPATCVYLIHRPDFPSPKGLHPEQVLMPPAALLNLSTHWLRLDMSPDDTQHKWQAIQAYQSQLPLLQPLLERFARQNELFGQLEPAGLPAIVAGAPSDPTAWRDSDGNPIAPVELDTARDLLVRNTIAAADLVALYAGREPDGRLLVCAQARGKVEPALTYVLHVTTAGPEGVKQHMARWGLAPGGSHPATGSGHTVCGQFAAEELGQPWVLVIGAEVKGTQIATLDRMAYQFVVLPSPNPPGAGP